jgi:WD40 repeat protein
MNRILKYIVLAAALSKPAAEAKWSLERVLQGHRDYISGLLKISDTIVVSASFDGSVKVFDVKQGVCKQTLLDHFPSVDQRTPSGGDMVLNGLARAIFGAGWVDNLDVTDEATRRGNISLVKCFDDSFLAISERYQQLTRYTLVNGEYRLTSKTNISGGYLFGCSPEVRDSVIATGRQDTINVWNIDPQSNAVHRINSFNMRAAVAGDDTINE